MGGMEESTTGTFSEPSSDSVTELTLPAGVMLGLRERVAMADLAEFFDRAMPAVAAEFARLGITPAGPPIAVYRHEIGHDFDVTVGFPVSGPLANAGRLVMERLPAGHAVRAEHVGPYETLSVVYAALSAWLGAHKLVPPDVIWEEYLVGPGSGDESAYRTRVVYPLP